MTSIAENIQRIKQELPSTTKLIVVSKYRSIEEIQKAYDAGQRHFAENRVQALLERKDELPQDIHWHLIGHLQTNKVKYIADFIYCIHSVDSLKLAKEINKQAQKSGRQISILVQTHVAEEESKFGVSPEEFIPFIESLLDAHLDQIKINGIMGMATFTDSKEQISKEFAQISQLQSDVQQTFGNKDLSFSEKSIGMSGDYLIAVKHGSTMVRIGSAVFKID